MTYTFNTESNLFEVQKDGNIKVQNVSNLTIEQKAFLNQFETVFKSCEPIPPIKQIASITTSMPDEGIEYISFHVTTNEGGRKIFNYCDLKKNAEFKLIIETFFAVFPNFKNLIVEPISPTRFNVDGVISEFNDYTDIQKKAIDDMGIMVTTLINM